MHLQLRVSHLFLACGLMVVVSIGSIAKATDLTITDSSPELLFVDNFEAPYEWRFAAGRNGVDIVDLTGSTIPLHMTRAAPTASLTIDSTGFVGLGTYSAARNLHLFSQENPTLRFEQGNTVFDPYKWDVGGNESNFFVQDVNAGNTVPFIIRPGAPTHSFEIASNGNVGYGTSSPLATLHIKKLAQASTAELMARFETSDDTVGALSIVNASATNGNFIPKIQGRGKAANVSIIHEGLVVTDSGSDPAIAFNGQKSTGGAMVTRPLVVFRNNNAAKATIAANGNVTATSFITASSRELKNNIRDLDPEKASSALRQLQPVEFVYKDDATAEPRVGFIAEDVPDIVAEPERKSVPVMDVVALLTRVVKDQDRVIEEQKKANERQQNMIDGQQRVIEELMKRMEALEGKE